MPIEEIIVYISHEPSVYMGLETVEPLKLNGIAVQTGYAPWPTAPDILCNSNDEVMCGLSFPVFDEQLDLVRKWVNEVNSNKFTLREISSKDSIYGYDTSCGFVFCLEVLWTQSPATKRISASLSEDIWYYDKSYNESEFVFYKHVVAIGLTSIEDVASDFGLKLPNKDSLPILVVSQV